MKRAIREHLRDFIAILAIVAFAVVTLLIILYNQKAAFPGWVPGLGQDFYELNADFSSGQAVTAGQGQAIDMAGIQIGKVGAVNLVDGTARIRMDIEPKYAKLIHSDATFLLRPKTGLNDMVVEVDPGMHGDTPKEGSTIPLSQTEPNVNPDEVLSILDGDTRAYLALLLQAGGKGLGGQGEQLSATLRRFQPFSRDLAKVGLALESRRHNIARVIHNFRLVSEELGANDTQLANFVSSSNAALGAFANQQASIRSALQELPPTLRATSNGLQRADRLSLVLGPASLRLIPAAQALKPALEGTQQLFTDTRAPLRNQIRPFTRQVTPVVRHLTQTAKPLQKTASGLNQAFTDLNNLLNKLAFNPPGSKKEGFLFYLPWLNHAFNSIFLAQDSEGPLRRGLIMVTCNTAFFAQTVGFGNDFLDTEFKTSGLPLAPEVCPVNPLTPTLRKSARPGVANADQAGADQGGADGRGAAGSGTTDAGGDSSSGAEPVDPNTPSGATGDLAPLAPLSTTGPTGTEGP